VSSGGNIGKERRMDEKGMMDGHRGWLKTPSDNAKCKKKASGERRAGGWLTCVAMHQLHLWILPATVVTRCVCAMYAIQQTEANTQKNVHAYSHSLLQLISALPRFAISIEAID